MARAPLPPNPVLQTATVLANEFLEEPTNETTSRIQNLMARNTNLGGHPQGYTFRGIRYAPNADKHDYIPDIDPSLEKEAEALYYRSESLQIMRTKLIQALSALHQRFTEFTVLRDALADAFIEATQLSVYPRLRPQHFYLKAYPMLAAPFRVIDEAILFRDRYRLLD